MKDEIKSEMLDHLNTINKLDEYLSKFRLVLDGYNNLAKKHNDLIHMICDHVDETGDTELFTKLESIISR